MNWYEDETFVKMVDCPEIQGLRPSGEYDFPCSIYFGRHIVEKDDSKPHLFGTSCPSDVGEGSIWLPRQDQLQGMVDPHIFNSPWFIWGKFKDFVAGKWWVNGVCEMRPEHYSYIAQFQSFEQLWIAFVMHELHNKHWSGSEWVERG